MALTFLCNPVSSFLLIYGMIVIPFCFSGCTAMIRLWNIPLTWFRPQVLKNNQALIKVMVFGIFE